MDATVKSTLKEGIYSRAKADKLDLILPLLNGLTRKHADGCEPYGAILSARSQTPGSATSLEDLPYIPVRLFKTHYLRSVPEDEVFKTLTSSGTTGQAVSRIVLDKETASLQTHVMVSIMQHFLGKARLPMLVIDHPGVVRSRESFSARGAGILGMANFGHRPKYVLKDETMDIDDEVLDAFIEANSGREVFLFGFTFMVWRYFIQALQKRGRSIDLSKGVLVHSGGWKKLEAEKVSNSHFKAEVEAWTGIKRVHNFYGMVEQVGSLFVECREGHLHAPVYSDIIVRDPMTLEPLPHGLEGIVQVVSVLPESYPGHSLLTEDKGTILGEDDCDCGMKGRYFAISGRLPKAEVRGCSDTFEKAA